MSRLGLLPSLGLHLRFVPEPPAQGACVVCHTRQGTEARCERCGIWMHWSCFMEAIADVRDLDGIRADDEDDPANLRVLLCSGCRS